MKDSFRGLWRRAACPSGGVVVFCQRNLQPAAILHPIAAHRFPQESRLLGKARAGRAEDQVQAQQKPVAERQGAILLARDQPARFLAIQETSQSTKWAQRHDVLRWLFSDARL